MPYIEQEDREELRKGRQAETPGELNYLLTNAMLTITDEGSEAIFMELRPKLWHLAKRYLEHGELRYQRINDVVGAFYCAHLEYQRRRPQGPAIVGQIVLAAARDFYTKFAASYEDQKIKTNGDVYT